MRCRFVAGDDREGCPEVVIRPRTIHTRALVLRWVAYSNTSQVVTVFTRDHGMLSVLARGSLRLSKRSSSFPQPFDLAGWYDLVYRPRSSGDLALALEARLVEGFDHLRRDYRSFVEATFALELIAKFFRPEIPAPEFLRGALSFLKLLAVGRGRTLLRTKLVASLLDAAGVGPDWNHCLDCGRPLADVTHPVVRLPDGAVCDDCGAGGDRALSPVVRRLIAALPTLDWGDLPELTVPGSVTRPAWALERDLVHYQLGAPLRTLEFLQE